MKKACRICTHRTFKSIHNSIHCADSIGLPTNHKNRVIKLFNRTMNQRNHIILLMTNSLALHKNIKTYCNSCWSKNNEADRICKELFVVHKSCAITTKICPQISTLVSTDRITAYKHFQMENMFRRFIQVTKTIGNDVHKFAKNKHYFYFLSITIFPKNKHRKYLTLH